MKILVNGEPRHLAGGSTVAELLAALGGGQGRVAVEVNREIVPRSRHAEHRLEEGDTVELVQAMGGG